MQTKFGSNSHMKEKSIYVLVDKTKGYSRYTHTSIHSFRIR